MHGKVGTATVLTKIGKKKFMEHWKSTIRAYQVMALLTPEAPATIKIQDHAYQWIDPMLDKIVVGGCLLLNEALKLSQMFKQIFMPSFLRSRPSNLLITAKKCQMAFGHGI
jgi:hypothetical protein